MEGMLGFQGDGMVQTEKCLVDILWHADVDVLGGGVPSEVKSQVFGAGPVSGDGRLGGESGNEVIGIFLADIHHTKIINNEAKGDGAGVMSKKARGVFAFAVAMLGEVDE
jgi:hypothetical protein